VSVQVRPATLDDLAEVVRSEELNLGGDAWSDRLIAQGVSGDLPTVLYLVAEAGAGPVPEILGHAVASIVDEMAELQRIAVHHPHRRRGVAGLLLARVEQEARAGGARRLLLEVREDNVGALAFYARRGFTELSRRPRYFRDGSAAVVMEKALTGPLGAPRTPSA
jgi:ribosomal-protein-alanine N-acetyltransferase